MMAFDIKNLIISLNKRFKKERFHNNLYFIVGKPRSGTTWLLSIIENSPNFKPLTVKNLKIKSSNQTKETGLFLRGYSKEEIVKKIKRLNPSCRYIEKTPSHIFKIKEIKEIFPTAKIILIKRNPIDVINSMVQKNKFWHDSPKDLNSAISLFNKFNEYEKKYKNLIDYQIRYEKLWNNPVKEIKKIHKFLNIKSSNSEIMGIISKTEKGNSLPIQLKKVFRKGKPNNHNFSLKEIRTIKNGIR